LLLDFDINRDIYLVFMNTTHALDSVLKDGFRHVYAIERQALGWICTDPSTSDLHTYILPASYSADVMGEFTRRHPYFTILHLHVKPHNKKLFPSIGVISCVSAMQYMLGIYWPFVLTPYQLYNKMVQSPPKHIEVIAWHDIHNTQHKGKRRPQQQQQTRHAKT
jgi:hypothetical protein